MREKKELHLAGGLLIAGLALLIACSQVKAEAAKEDLKQSDEYLSQGNAAYNKGQLDPALQDANKAISLNPRSLNAYVLRSGIYFASHRYDLAEADDTQAIALASSPLIRIALYNNRGSRYLLTYRVEAARDDFTKAIQVDPTVYLPYAFRGVTYVTMGDFDKAETDLKRANSLAPETWRFGALVPLANLYFLKGDFKKSISTYDQAFASKADNPDTLFGRGRAKLISVSPAAAIDDLASSVQLNPKSTSKSIWLHFARQDLEQDDKAEWEHNVEASQPDTWQAHVVAFLNGQSSSDDLMKATADPNEHLQKVQVCQATYYIGRSLLTTNHDEALKRFRTADQNCPPSVAERVVAHVALAKAAER